MSTTLDNSIDPPMTRTVIITDTEANISRQFGCVICSLPFSVIPMSHESNKYRPQQTLFCPTCMETLQALFKREKTKDYGW